MVEKTFEEAPEPELKPKTNLFQVLLPIVLTLAIFWWIFSGIDLSSLKEALVSLDWPKLALVVGAFCVWIVIGDTLSFGAAFKVILASGAPWFHMMLLRAGSIFSTVIFPPLAEVFAPYYFYKRYQTNVLRTVGTSFFVVLVDSSCAAIALSIAFLFFDTSMLSLWWLVLLCGHLTLLTGFAIAFSRLAINRLPGFFREREFFFALNHTDWKFTAYILLVRLSIFLGAALTLYFLLHVTGIDIGPAQALLFIPLFMASVFLPISTGGYGGPQGAALLFLVEWWALCTAEQALVFSLLWSTLFMIGRAVAGGVFLVPLWLVLKKVGESH